MLTVGPGNMAMHAPSLFFGKPTEDFELWQKTFFLTMNFNKWDKPTALTHLPSFLRDQAFLEFLQLDEETRKDFDATMNALKKVFSRSDPFIDGHLFRSLSMAPLESVWDFRRRLIRAHDLAFGDRHDDKRNRMLIDQFLFGLRNDSLRYKLMHERIESFDKLVETADTCIRMDQAALSMHGEGYTPSQSNVLVPDYQVCAIDAGVKNQVADLSVRMLEVEKRLTGVEKLSSRLDSVTESQTKIMMLLEAQSEALESLKSSARPVSANTRGQEFKCFRCASRQHGASNCSVPREQLLCETCSGVGHVAEVCRRSRRSVFPCGRT